jgi:ADP-ribose pyrophosphatase YjhB (NUDIX family)
MEYTTNNNDFISIDFFLIRHKMWVEDEVFYKCQEFFPFCCVDIVVIKDDGFILTRRAIGKDSGLWHLPGGIVKKLERLEDRAHRAAHDELGIEIEIRQYLGIFERISKDRHDICHAYLCNYKKGEFQNDKQSDRIQIFKTIPTDIIDFQIDILRKAGFS